MGSAIDVQQPRLYSILSPNSIRLLRLNPGALQAEAGVLEVVRLSEAPPFFTLSHCWGPRMKTLPIRIGCGHIYVSQDLYHGIQQLRRLAVDSATILGVRLRRIWIDSICINQDDQQERASQVQLMHKIYARSIRTLVWLGPDFASASVAWKLVDQVYQTFRCESPRAETLEDIPLSMYSDVMHMHCELPTWEDPVWPLLKRLFDTQWFFRTWVLQEVVNSPLDPIIIHGPHLHSWSRLGWAASWLRRKGYTRLRQVSQGVLNVDTMCIIRRSGVAWPLDALLSMTQIKFHATDQRDKVWGLLGLAAECQDKIPEPLQPNYTISVEQAYQRVAHFLLDRTRNLALLTRTRGARDGLTRSLTSFQRLHSLPGLPTWCPDWSDFADYSNNIRVSFSWVHYFTRHQYQPQVQQPVTLGYPDNYRAAAGLGLEIHRSSINAGDISKEGGKSLLRVSGVLVTRVKRVVPFNRVVMSRDQFHEEFDDIMIPIIHEGLSLTTTESIQVVERDRASSVNEALTILDWATEFVRVTTAQQQKLGGHSWELCLRGGLQYLLKAVAALGFSKPSCAGHRSSTAAKTFDIVSALTKAIDLTGQEDETDLDDEMSRYVSLVRNFGYNRCFFTTQDGRMGLGSSAARPGDTVVVLLGSGVPFLLRERLIELDSVERERDHVSPKRNEKIDAETECQWNVVGESYVGGLMSGEAIEACQCGSLVKQVLVLA